MGGGKTERMAVTSQHVFFFSSKILRELKFIKRDIIDGLVG